MLRYIFAQCIACKHVFKMKFMLTTVYMHYNSTHIYIYIYIYTKVHDYMIDMFCFFQSDPMLVCFFQLKQVTSRSPFMVLEAWWPGRVSQCPPGSLILWCQAGQGRVDKPKPPKLSSDAMLKPSSQVRLLLVVGGISSWLLFVVSSPDFRMFSKQIFLW